MHPQMRQSEPGSCPICGMAPEPEGGSAAPAAERKVSPPDVANFASVTGKGVTGVIAGRPVEVGNAFRLRAAPI